jgi:hypothetical protein
MLQDLTATREEVQVMAELGGPAPRLLWRGSFIRPSDWFLLCEGTIVNTGHSNLIKAVECLLGTFYTAEMEYPKKAFNTFSYIQVELLGLVPKTIPPKVCTLIKEVNKY